MQADPAPVWEDSREARLRALVLLEKLHAALLGCDSATLLLERWCEERGLASPAEVIATRDLAVVKAPTEAQLRALAVEDGSEVRYRRVRLSCRGHVLSEADNWYVPGRLTPEMNLALDGSDVAFGRAVRSLQCRRRTLSASLLWRPAPEEWAAQGVPPVAGGGRLVMPPSVLRHRALLMRPDGRPISEVSETYMSAVLGSGV